MTDHIGDDAGLEALLRPRRIAVIGASAKPGHFANTPLVNLRRHGFDGEVYPVNPGHQEIDGWRCYASLRDVPHAPDLAVVVVRPDLAVPAVAECARRGVRAAVVVASGFAETGDAEGATLQRELSAVIATTGIRVCGPNTLGIANFNDDTVPFASTNLPAKPVKGAVAVVSQSGGCGFTLLNRAWGLGIGVGHLAVAGNEIDVSIPELVAYYLGRADVRTVVCYIEAIRDADGLRAVGELSARTGKPVFVMKAGSTPSGERAAAAHTGALAASDAVCDAALQQWRLPRARSFDGLIAAGALAARFAAPPRGHLGVYAQGGGLAVVTADMFSAVGLELPTLSPATVTKIKALMPDTTPGNPFDSGGRFLSSGVDLLTAGLTAFAADDNLDVIVHCLMPVVGQRISVYAEGIARVARASTKPNLVLQYRAGTLTEPASAIFRDAGLLAIDPPEAGVEGIGLWLGWSRQVPPEPDTAGRRTSRPPRRRSAAVGAKARRIVEGWRAAGARTVAEYDATSLLTLYDLPVARQVLLRDPADAGRATSVLNGPYAVKVASPDLPHRSDVGGVVLGVADTTGVAEAAARVMANARVADPNATVVGATVAEMARPGTELIAGIRIDPSFGPVVMLGLGGVWTEMLHDTALRLPPVDDVSAIEMMRSLRGAGVLFGERGHTRVDVGALADVIVRLGELAMDLGDSVRIVEVNPLIAYPDGLRIVDALVELPG